MPFQDDLDNKQLFYNLLKKYDTKQIYTLNSDTFIFDQINVNHKQPGTMQDFLNMEQKEYKGPWIYKPAQNVGGVGIKIFENLEAAQKFSRQVIQEQPKYGKIGVYQKFRKDLGLLNKKKFDIRNYLIFARNEENKELVYYEQGYIRQTLNDYNPESLEKAQNLANYNIQKELIEINELTFSNTATTDIEHLKQYLKDNEKFSEQKINEIFHKIKVYLTYIAQCVLQEYPKMPGNYQIFGMDIMFDDQWNPYVLEANKYPGVARKFYEQIVNKNRLIKNVGDLLLQVFKNNQDQEYKINLSDDSNLELLIDQQNQFNYIEEQKFKNQQQQKELKQEL